MTETFTKTPDERIAEILGRYSVTDLVEQTDDDLRKADEQFYKSDKSMQIIGQGRSGLIDWWKIQSGDEIYETRRFKNFCWCQCKAFFYRKKVCRHLAMTAGVLCSHCGVSRAKVGKLCYDCQTRATMFMKPFSQGERA